ncbi:hypothetical protein M3689_19995 [Alkalihalophilus marmarensis]|uniref:DUF4365 domain-containing protein n=1 Tax=Alkalihalophilus marmarensis DSM 21297 TaxID=1188261 RepID=U6SKW1_9BACI|nr:hypothetical protein [Alkalihalophilus marmarensis]ERN51281.1 hypothetical protein A33I_20595 [Alkalihalophilus marmarensis DSM 21297]MCM3491575.1 hypothetical protein [Alkalihalophilus marmarensis]
MNTKKIEEIAVAAVRNEILKNDFLSDEIPTNDKTPSWDGEIWTYNNQNQRKDTLFGKVPVQVKGKKVDTISVKKTKFKIQKADLENYYKNGGILFFVIEIIDSQNTQVFYLSLLPIDIKKILTELKDKKSITKEFKMLPSTEKALEFITRNFIHHSRKQSISLIDDIKVNEFDTYTGKLFVLDKNNLTDDLFEYGTYMYGRLEELNLEVPLYKVDIQQMTEETDLWVGLNENIIYEEVIRIIEKEKITLRFGKSFVIEFPKILESSKQIKIHFNENGSIQDRIKDCNFMWDLVKEKSITIKDIKIPLNNFDEKEKFLKEIPEYIRYLEQIEETFNQLGVSFNLEFENLTHDDFKKIEILKDIILNKNYGKVNLNPENHFLQFLINDLKIILVSLKTEKGWLVFNLFDLDAINNNFKITAVSGDKKHQVRHSPFIIFEMYNLFSMSNLNLKVIVESLKQVDYKDDYALDLTNNFLLKALIYYDQQKENGEILNLLLDVYDFLYHLQPNNILIFLNKMQVIKRKREFTWEEKQEIFEKKSRGFHNDDILCGFSILLESKIEFEVHFKKLNEEQKEGFKLFPIYNLLRSKNS